MGSRTQENGGYSPALSNAPTLSLQFDRKAIASSHRSFSTCQPLLDHLLHTSGKVRRRGFWKCMNGWSRRGPKKIEGKQEVELNSPKNENITINPEDQNEYYLFQPNELQNYLLPSMDDSGFVNCTVGKPLNYRVQRYTGRPGILSISGCM